MIDNLKIFFKEFISRKGNYVFFATVLGRILSFLSSWIALKLIPNFELGLVIYALNIISLIIPLSGFGASQGLLRFGALSKNEKEKNNLFVYILKKGSVFSIIIIVIIIIFSSLLTNQLKESQSYLIYLSLLILTLFLLESLKTQLRVLHKNKTFAKTEIIYNILLVILVFFGSYFYKETGYIIALIIVPLITFLIFIPKRQIKFNIDKNFKKPTFSFWKYSLFSSMSNVATQLLIVLDIILIGSIMHSPEKVTIYKYVSLIPFSLLFLPRVLLTTDFVSITENISNKKYINNYIKNYIILFLLISLVIAILSFAFDDSILLFFGNEFKQYTSTFKILIFGIISILIFRGLFGNLLSALGKASVNYWIAFIAILLNLVLNFILIPIYGILGAAITSTFMMWITSLLSIILFYKYYRKI